MKTLLLVFYETISQVIRYCILLPTVNLNLVARKTLTSSLSGSGDKLTVDKIQTLGNYMADTHLVVLSACETALGGADADGLEMSGMSFYFLTNGAKAVIASLWLVNDASTSQLMQQFYQNLSTGQMTKTEALRQAQLAILKSNSQGNNSNRSSVNYKLGDGEQSISRNLSHPYYWAPFILIGNGS